MNKGEFKRRRQELIQRVGVNNAAFVVSASTHTRNKDVAFTFRQDSDFYYLTGFNEPNAVAVFIPGRELGEYLLFCQPRNPAKAVWDGDLVGLEDAVSEYGADAAFAIEEANNRMLDLLKNKRKVFYHVIRDGGFEGCPPNSKSQIEFASLERILHEMRLFKSSAELTLMRQAMDISMQAHQRAMRICKEGMYEYQLEAEIIYDFMRQGFRTPAYPSIVAAGANACVLHYVANKDKLKKGDLLLIDAGVECDHYAADITRTFPVSGKFSSAQKKLYQVVLDAQYAAIEQVRPGVAWNKIHQASATVITQGLLDLGLLKGSLAQLIKDQAYKQFYMHRAGHWLGMDVHDVGDYMLEGKSRPLEPGMVLTVEPGLYIPANCTAVEPKWRGIGIRIEDNVLVTKQGNEVLTENLVKEVDAIEHLMQAD